MVDVAYIGPGGDAQGERLEILALHKLSTAERAMVEASVLVLDGAEMDDAALDTALDARRDSKARLLVLFRLSHGTSFRARREALLAAGAADVMDATGRGDEFLTRVRALMLTANPPEVLVVEDDQSIADWAVAELQDGGMIARSVGTLAKARAAFQAGRIDALVVDRQLPDGDGLDFVAELRGLGIRTPALLFTAMDEISDRIAGLEGAQADDYICKPVHADELRARVRLLLRPVVSDETLFYGPLELNRRDRIVRWKGNRIKMRDKERDMLIYLAERANLAIPQQMIYLDVWEKVFMEVGSNPVTAARARMVRDIKSFLKEQGETYPEFIGTEGSGYVFLSDPLLKLPPQ